MVLILTISRDPAPMEGAVCLGSESRLVPLGAGMMQAPGSTARGAGRGESAVLAVWGVTHKFTLQHKWTQKSPMGKMHFVPLGAAEGSRRRKLGALDVWAMMWDSLPKDPAPPDSQYIPLLQFYCLWGFLSFSLPWSILSFSLWWISQKDGAMVAIS